MGYGDIENYDLDRNSLEDYDDEGDDWKCN